MLNPASDPAERFLANTKIGGDHSKWDPFENMRVSLKKIFIQLGSSFKLCIYKSFFQAEIIFFVGNSYQSFDLMKLIK